MLKNLLGSISKEAWLGILRQLITFLSGLVALKGWLSEDTVMLFSSSIISIATIIFSWVSDTKKNIQDQINGVIRHLATLLGGVGVLKGWFDGETMIALGASLSTIIATIWSVLSKPAPMPE